ncbi:hypothetical protein [uncultured Winogradskyella sp.]|uniref:hypothetical protein n=1 Tax=uncultured Winogradskyella sp. TaxID=395353 RepID=UPI00260A6EBA|nr:hypothetical protein [uncultured Winogradskyella sp.]
MKNLTIKNTIVICSIFLLGCKNDNVEGVILGNTIVVHQDYSENKKMSSLIKSSLNKDSKAFKQLIHFPTGGAQGSYDHGFIITQIIYKNGELETIKILKDFNKKNLNLLQGLISVGLAYGDNNYDDKMDNTNIRNEFPKLFKYLNEKI